MLPALHPARRGPVISRYGTCQARGRQNNRVVVCAIEFDEKDQNVIAELTTSLSQRFGCTVLTATSYEDGILVYELYQSIVRLDEDNFSSYALDSNAESSEPEGDFRKPLRVAVIGGVITSTILTLIVVPTIYEILDGVRELVGTRLGFRTPQTGEHKVPVGAVPRPVMGD